MLTRPAVFAEQQMSMGTDRHIIIKIVDNQATPNTFYFSDIEMELTEGHVHGLIQSDISINESFDIFTRKWQVGDISLTLSNIPYRANASSSDTRIRVSDDLKNIQGGTIDVYLVAGSRTTSIADALKRFSGIILDPPLYTDRQVKISATQTQKLNNITLPKRAVKDEYVDAPNAARSLSIPLMYGNFSFQTGDTANLYDGNGMAKAIIASTNPRPDYLFADHAITNIGNTGLWVDVGSSVLVDSGDKTDVTTGPSSGTISACIPLDEDAFLDFSLNGQPPSDYNASTYTATNAGNIAYPSVTKATLTDNVSDSGATQEALAVFGFDNPAAFQNLWANSSSTIDVYYSNITWLNTPSYGTFDVIEWRLYYGRSGGGDHMFAISRFPTDGTPTWDNVSQIGMNHPRLYADLLYDFDTEPMFGIYIKDYTSNDADGTVDNDNVFEIGRCVLKIECSIGTWGEYETCWIAGDGRAYGTWINSRSSNYASGGVIKDPSGIVESLLRDEVGLVNADLDQPSFINAENTSVESRINIFKQRSVYDIIRQITEQSTFAFCYNALGVAKLIPLNDSTPTTATRGSHPVKVPWSHIDHIQITKSKEIVNNLKVKSRWQEEYGVYRDEATTTNSTSDTTFGTRTYNAKWPNICGTSATHVANFLVGNANGIWANEHVVVTLRTKGFTCADIELGDWIELDSTSVDSQIKAYGTSWAGKQLLVTELKQTQDYTQITGIELY